MLSAFASAFRTPDLRKKLLFTLAMIARLPARLERADAERVDRQHQRLHRPGRNGASRDLYSLVNLFSGGALLQLAVFALGIMPYITASIIIQLLVVVIPRFEQLKKEGQSGQTKLTQYTRYLTIGLADPAVHRHHRAGPQRPAVPGLRPPGALPARTSSRWSPWSSR